MSGTLLRDHPSRLTGHPVSAENAGTTPSVDSITATGPKSDIAVRHIAIVSETYAPEVNGVAMTTGRMVRGLLETGNRVHLIAPQCETRPGIAEGGGLFQTTRVLGFSIPFYPQMQIGFPSYLSLLRTWKKDRPDVVNIVTEGPLGVAAVVAARKLNIPVITDFHTNFHHYCHYYGVSMLASVAQSYLSWFHRKSLMTLVPTRELAVKIRDQLRTSTRVVARGVDLGLFNPGRRSESLRASWGCTPDTPVCLSVGRLAKEKNLPLLLSTFEEISRQVPAAKLVIVGDGPEQDSVPDDPRIIKAGRQSGEALAASYASADVFLFPSKSETYGNVVAEAMASGLAVCAFDYAAAREHVASDAGRICDFEDDKAFVENAVALARDLGGSRRMGRVGLRKAQNLRWVDVVHQLRLAYEAAICGTTVNQTVGREGGAV